MDNLKSFMEKMRASYTAIAVIYLILGFCLAAKPEIFASLICYVVGGVFLAFAIITIIRCIAATGSTVLQPTFIMAIISAAIGLLIMFNQGFVVSIMPFIVGIILVVSGVVKLQDGASLRALNYDRWGSVAVLSIISIIFGVIMIVNPFGTGVLFIRIMGIFFIIDGIMSIYSAVVLKKISK